MRRLAAIGRLATIFGLSLAAGVAGYIWLGRSAHVRSEPTTGATPPRVAAAAPDATPQFTNRPPTAAAASPPSTAPAATVGPKPAAPARTERPDERDRLSRKEARRLVERVFEGKLPDRELHDDDYDRLTDAVLRLRSALRNMRRRNGPRANPAAAGKQREIVASALAEIERITGVPPANLGEVLASDNLTSEENDSGTVGRKTP